MGESQAVTSRTWNPGLSPSPSCSDLWNSLPQDRMMVPRLDELLRGTGWIKGKSITGYKSGWVYVVLHSELERDSCRGLLETQGIVQGVGEVGGEQGWLVEPPCSKAVHL